MSGIWCWVQAQHKEAAGKETVSRKRVRIIVWPMILYFAFILAAGYYFYARIEHGMGGLTAPLRSYSYFVLFVEMLGAVNMLFYACWLFARPVNTDVFPPANEKGAVPHCCTSPAVGLQVAALAMLRSIIAVCRRAATTSAQVHCASADPLLQGIAGDHTAYCACRSPCRQTCWNACDNLHL